jgi:hypothetical protein
MIWLQPELRSAIEAILSAFTTRYKKTAQDFKEMGNFGRQEIEQTCFANAYDKWIRGQGPEGLPAQLRNFDKTLERVFGTGS